MDEAFWILNSYFGKGFTTLLTECFCLPFRQNKCPAESDDEGEDFIMEHDHHVLTPEDLNQFTSQFSSENLVGVTELGKLYRGKMHIGSDVKDVAVKIIYDNKNVYHYTGDDTLERFENELKILQASRIRGNPNIVKVIGYCRGEKTLGIVYDLNPHDTLENLITRGDFNWMQRVKIALTLARLLNYLHDRKYLIRNFAPYHIMVDQDFTPIMYEFGLLVGGVLRNKISASDFRLAPYGYIDGSLVTHGPDTFTVRSDVFAFGILLVNLISKRVVVDTRDRDDAINMWVLREFKSGRSVVHQTLVGDPGFDPLDGTIITQLAIQCIEDKPKKRPNMKEVIECLETLRVVQEHDKEVNSFYRNNSN
ncbi:probable serine/threonine-protein kinase PBL15 [Solanum verrucosum]|uniref:probable serine/threonine-protein kinase PBL15 n=1 Tax=Solanum verrucosum TaxID=315347 RepID=UPI0020D1325E|nr:probable serine/threonine-protein kinase PBL15 [Solanum verrucosum]